ncbi:MAG: hypothetical protein GW910_06090 [Candidatus Altiarchaeum hamiconexum]|uniref:Uncharacterized protein n=1 Tax=Candidatus Altarchaeum hamiconexum TaxID=1803513 RepID=A0A8J8CJX3_9ARCH|nr:hypothetical protein [Candidatus Altarchaeum hamiconexum]
MYADNGENIAANRYIKSREVKAISAFVVLLNSTARYCCAAAKLKNISPNETENTRKFLSTFIFIIS